MSKTAEALRAKCHSLLTADRYNVSIVLQPLEEAVNSQCADNWYDPELNAALLKLYQMYPSESEKVVKVEILVKILLKALMQLPEPDFPLALMMVPEYLQNLETIKIICSLHEKLQTASFPEFWELARLNPDLIHKVPGFQVACRRHVFRVVGMTFREISSASLAKYLGLASARDLGGVLSPDVGAFLNEDDGVVALAPNSDNHPKNTRVTATGQEIRLEQLSELIASLEANSKSIKSTTTGRNISLSGKTAVEKMNQAINAANTQQY